MIRSTLTALFCLASLPVATTALSAQPVSPSDPAAAPVTYPYLETLEARLDAAMADRRIVGLVAAVIEDGEPVFYYTHGETAAGSGEAVTPQTLFRAASVSKTFTGTLLGLLEAEGLVDLSAPVPGDVLRLRGDRQPTLEEIASHRTGLPPNAYDLDLEAGQAPDRIRQRLASVDLMCPVGDCYTYQNIAFSALERVVAQATGEDFSAALRGRLIEPLGLPAASVGTAALTASPSWARPHSGWRRIINLPGDPSTPYDDIPSASGLNLSLEDMIVWAQLQLGTRPGLSDAVRSRIHSPLTDTLRETRRLGELRARVDQTWYGLGWRIYDWEGRTLVLHSGYLSGYGAQIVLEPETGFAFVALWNSDNRPAWWLWPTVMDLRTGNGPGTWLDRFEED
ncbi:serine hydrolase domain-containing protein [Maricaulis maris]|uniref:Beta-lactamase class C n=1 Tax=Maricaulis maris TaxID=74318 RepID=A0A495D318_9PROT|nr:serine hydrolase domain-containing protein [Maricaulis maris]RKQ96153.1 beta-lactamase class C [Maricaulis maris]